MTGFAEPWGCAMRAARSPGWITWDCVQGFAAAFRAGAAVVVSAGTANLAARKAIAAAHRIPPIQRGRAGAEKARRTPAPRRFWLRIAIICPEPVLRPARQPRR